MALVSVSDYERKSGEFLAKNSWDYYQSGAGDEFSLRLNRTSYDWSVRNEVISVWIIYLSISFEVFVFDHEYSLVFLSGPLRLTFSVLN